MMVPTLLCPETKWGLATRGKQLAGLHRASSTACAESQLGFSSRMIACSNSEARWRLKHCSSNRTGSSPPSVVLEHRGTRRVCPAQESTNVAFPTKKSSETPGLVRSVWLWTKIDLYRQHLYTVRASWDRSCRMRQRTTKPVTAKRKSRNKAKTRLRCGRFLRPPP